MQFGTLRNRLNTTNNIIQSIGVEEISQLIINHQLKRHEIHNEAICYYLCPLYSLLCL
jgi:hypothetical protein